MRKLVLALIPAVILGLALLFLVSSIEVGDLDLSFSENAEGADLIIDVGTDMAADGSYDDAWINNELSMNSYDLWIDGDLTINATGILDGNASASLTANGTVTVNGELDLHNGEDHSVGSLTANSGSTVTLSSGTTTITSESGSGSGISMLSGSTFTHNNGLMKVTGNVGTFSLIEWFATGNMYDFELDLVTPSESFRQNTPLTIDNDFTVTNGLYRFGGAITRSLTVTGAVLISDELDGQSTDAPASFGSLTINSGGTFTSTSGVLTCSGDYTNDGKHTHNITVL